MALYHPAPTAGLKARINTLQTPYSCSPKASQRPTTFLRNKATPATNPHRDRNAFASVPDPPDSMYPKNKVGARRNRTKGTFRTEKRSSHATAEIAAGGGICSWETENSASVLGRESTTKAHRATTAKTRSKINPKGFVRNEDTF